MLNAATIIICVNIIPNSMGALTSNGGPRRAPSLIYGPKAIKGQKCDP
jgi:hypothetical protein